MNRIETHLAHMLAGEKTTMRHADQDLLGEISATHLDPRALARLGLHVLKCITADLKGGIHAQKAMSDAMSKRND